MSGTEVFIDTNIAIHFLNGDKDVAEILKGCTVLISFISELELLSYPTINSKEEAAVRKFIGLCIVVGYNNELRDVAVELRKNSKLKLPDAIIGATSLQVNLPLITADRQFAQVENLNVLLYEMNQ